MAEGTDSATGPGDSGGALLWNGRLAGGYSDWRLPTQKELYMSYIEGIWGRKTPLGLLASYYWSSTTVSDTTTFAWHVHLGYGYVNGNQKTNSTRVVCAR